MQRLLNLLRNSQNYCSDNNCVEEMPGPEGTPGAGGMSMMLMMMGWLVVATALFLLRPNSLRGQGDQKPATGNGGNPPPPPAPGVH